MSWIPDKKTKVPSPGLKRGLRLTFAALFLCLSMLAATGCGLRLDDEELVARARLAAEQNEYRAAIIDLKSVLQRDPRNIDARVTLGRVHLQVDEPFAAEKELRRAIELGLPKSQVVVSLGEALLAQRVFDMVLTEIDESVAETDADRLAIKLIRGNAELSLGRTAQARRLYVNVLETDSENGVAYLGMASTYLAENQPEQAAVSIDRAIEVARDSAPAWMARGTFNLNRRLTDNAESDFAMALELAAAQNDRAIQQMALAGLADIYLLKGDLRSAEQSAARLNSLAPDSITARYTAARVAFATEDIDSAVVLLQGILQDAPDFRQAHFLYGAVNRVKGNLAQAEMYLASAVVASPQNAEARKLLADVRLRQHKLREASEAIEPLLSDDEPADDYLLAVAGVIKLQSGEESEGLDLFKRSVDADPDNLERRLDLATIYLAVGQADQAIAILESMVGTNVDKRRLDVLTVISLQRQGNLDGAIMKAEELLETSPDNVQLHTVLGGVYEESGDLSAARSSLEDALRLDTMNIAALLQLGRIDTAESRYADARLRYRRALQIAPDSVPVILQMARLAMLEGDAASSVNWLEKARHSSKDALLPRIQLATHYLSQQRHAEAMQVAEEAVAIDNADARARNLLGVTQMTSGDFDSAAGSFAEAIRIAPEVAAYRYNRARAEFKRGNQRAALRIIQENYLAHSEHIPSATLLADYYLRNGDFAAATDIAINLQKLLPNNAAGLALHGDILAVQEKFEDAVRMYDQAQAVEQSRKLAIRGYHLRVKAANPEPYQPIKSYLDSNPSDSVARMFLAETYHLNGEIGNASAEYEQLLQTNPENVVALNNLAWVLLDKGDPRALELAEAAYRILPDDGAIADTYGWILLNHNQSEKATAILRKAVAAMPENSEIHYHFAVALLEVGNADEAHVILEKIVASDQTFASRTKAEQLIGKIR